MHCKFLIVLSDFATIFKQFLSQLLCTAIFSFEQRVITINPEEIIMSIVSEKGKEFGRLEDFEIKLSNDSIIIMEEHFKYAVNEIIDNALSHINAGTVITLSSRIEKKRYYLYIMDYGSGFPEDYIIYDDPFKRKHILDFNRNNGGLGLAIVKKLLTLYNGSFNIESEAGFFTLVKIILPVKDEITN